MAVKDAAPDSQAPLKKFFSFDLALYKDKNAIALLLLTAELYLIICTISDVLYNWSEVLNQLWNETLRAIAGVSR